MSDEAPTPTPTPEELAAEATARLQAIFRGAPDGGVDWAAYRTVGVDGLEDLLRQAVRPPAATAPPNADEPPLTFNSAAEYAVIREKLLADDERRRPYRRKR